MSAALADDSLELMARMLTPIRDQDALPGDVADRPLVARHERRREFLNRAISGGLLQVRASCWANISEIGIGLTDDASWLVRVKYLAIARTGQTAGVLQATIEADAPADKIGRVLVPLRASLTRAVHKAILETFEHELAESIFYEGALLLDPHAGEEGSGSP